MSRHFDPNKYLGGRFDLARHNCWHVLREVWLDLTGEDLGDRTPERITAATLISTFDADVPAAFKKLDRPVNPCLVLMTRPAEVPHVGVHIRGRILQMQPGGVTFLPVARAVFGFTEVGFYRPCRD